jgi:hypothetical protein
MDFMYIKSLTMLTFGRPISAESRTIKIHALINYAPAVAAVVDLITGISVGDQDPDPQDPHVFWPPGSNSLRYGSWIQLRILPFSHTCVLIELK